jgi:hypothetical protein
MIELTKIVDDPDGLVKKLIFEDDEGAIAEMVVYRHNDRGVVCFSVQSGCPVGCEFCGTGKRFIRNLTQGEITNQLNIGASMIEDKRKRQFMAMSMGEPMLNFKNLVGGLNCSVLSSNDHFYISTVGIRRPLLLGELLCMGKGRGNFGLQFSLHSPYESERRKMLGNFGVLMSIEEIKHFANLWKAYTGKQVYFNYICRNVNPRQFISDLHEITMIFLKAILNQLWILQMFCRLCIPIRITRFLIQPAKIRSGVAVVNCCMSKRGYQEEQPNDRNLSLPRPPRVEPRPSVPNRRRDRPMGRAYVRRRGWQEVLRGEGQRHAVGTNEPVVLAPRAPTLADVLVSHEALLPAH